jgi:hypothetical protein
LRSQGGFRERLCSAQDERRFNASAKTSAGCTRAVEGLVEVAAYGKAVWSCRPAIFCPWGKVEKPLCNKGFFELAARVNLLAETGRALLGPSFTWWFKNPSVSKESECVATTDLFRLRHLQAPRLLAR